MRRVWAAALLLAAALAAAVLPCATGLVPPPAHLRYAVLLSQRPDPKAPWGSWHVTVAGYLPCQGSYGAGHCEKPPTGVTCTADPQKMARLAGQAWTAANAGYKTYDIRQSTLLNRANGLDQRAKIWDLPGKHTGAVMQVFAEELCKRGFGGLKGPQFGHYTWHMSLGTKSRQQAKKRLATLAKPGTTLRPWLVPCWINAQCSAPGHKPGCPCGSNWILIVPQ